MSVVLSTYSWPSTDTDCKSSTRSAAPAAESLAIGIGDQAFPPYKLGDDKLDPRKPGLSVELVFTAHPSEAKRRSIRAKLRRMRRSLRELDRTDLLPRERAAHEDALRGELRVLWQTEFLRPTRPTVSRNP